MISIKKTEEAILAEFCKIAKNNNDNYIVRDGLPFCSSRIVQENGIWKRLPGNEEERYRQMPAKPLLIGKDCPESSETEDLRTESFRVNDTPVGTVETINSRLHHNILSIVYGLLSYNLELGKCLDWDDKERLWSWNMSREFFETHPVPRINVKKVAGGNTIDPATLHYYMYHKDYNRLIVDQIKLYVADIIVCFGRDVFRFVIDPSNGLFDDIVEDTVKDPWIYFSPSRQKIVINSYHPSYWGISEEAFYTGMISEYTRFLNSHKEFAKKLFGKKIF